MTAQIQVRRDTTGNWSAANPVLKSGEMGLDTTTGYLKMGDGVTSWNTLPYSTAPMTVNNPFTYTAYTPTLAQGASSNIAKTVTYGKYFLLGKLVIGQVKVASTAAGTSGSAITLSLPVTAATSGLVVGSGQYLKTTATATDYRGVAYLLTTTTIAIAPASDAYTSPTSGTYLGIAATTPALTAFAVASGDVMNISFQYEAA